MTYRQTITLEIGEVDSLETLQGTSSAKIFLVNHKYVFKFHCLNMFQVVTWYLDNYQFAPEIIGVGDHFFYYKYEFSSGMITREMLSSFIADYTPLKVSASLVDYGEQLYKQYLANCEFLKVSPRVGKLDLRGEMYNLHGDAGLHNLIVGSEGLKLFDPEPKVGIIEEDLFQLYFSAPTIIQLLPLNELERLFNLEQSSFQQLAELFLVERMVRCTYHHPDDFEFYLQMYNLL